MTPLPVELSECDREPIHLLGSIQPHGALLALTPDQFLVQVASESCSRFLGRTATEALDRPLSELVPAAAQDTLIAAAAALSPGGSTLVALTVAGGPVDATVHLSDGLVVVELEDGQRDGDFRFNPFYGQVRQAMLDLQQADQVADLGAAVVSLTRRLTGFDRVMVYRFTDDGSGEVIAEDRRDDLPPFLGLHYPASDIPLQARGLYERNWIRSIASSTYEPSPLLAGQRWPLDRPLDLSGSGLRSVSPVHLEYLRNMGVGASMSVSLLREGKLWGLIACHHQTPRILSCEVRAACELFGVTVSLQLVALESRADVDYQSQIGGVHGRLVDQMATTSLVEGLVDRSVTVCDLVRAHGAAVFVGPQHRTIGRAPSPDDVARIVEVLPQLEPGQVWATEALSELHPELGHLAHVASGVLAARLPGPGSNQLLWFRGEVLQTVEWAGNPQKVITRDGDTQRVSPRKSFEAWQLTVRGKAQPWERRELDAAAALCRSVIDVLLRQAAELSRLNLDLERSNEELEAFAFIASHDLREPLRGISHYATFIFEDAAELAPANKAHLQALRALAERMDTLLDSLLVYSQVGRLDPVPTDLSLDSVVDEVLDVLERRIKDSDATVTRPGSLPIVRGDAVRLSEVLTNLVTNALKYAVPGHPPVLEIGAARTVPPGGEEAVTAVFVRDQGIGIDPKHHEDIFRIFKRLHASSGHGGGAGAGLTIARMIVQRHGGRMWVDSAPGEGSTFWFTVLEPPAAG